MPADDSYGRNMVSSTIKSGNPMSVANLNSMLNFNILNYIPLRQVIALSNSNGEIRDFTPPPFVQFQDMIDDVFILRYLLVGKAIYRHRSDSHCDLGEI